MYDKNIEYRRNNNFKFLPMTTIVGVKLDESIIIGSDSQSSTGDYKELYVEKIHQVGNVLFTGAGDSDYILKVWQELEEFCTKNPIKNPEELTSEIESILKRMYENHGFEKDWYSRFIVGLHYKNGDKNNYSLFRIDNYHRFSIKIPKYYSIGSGSIFANYVLKRVWEDGLKIDNVLFLVIYIINEATNIDIYSNPPIFVSYVFGDTVTPVPQDLIIRVQKNLIASDKHTIEYFKDFIFNRNIIEFIGDEIRIKKKK